MQEGSVTALYIGYRVMELVLGFYTVPISAVSCPLGCGKESRLSIVFFFKQKTAYELSTRDWSSDVCSSDLPTWPRGGAIGRSPGLSGWRLPEIGRASCREREEISVVAVSLKKTNDAPAG